MFLLNLLAYKLCRKLKLNSYISFFTKDAGKIVSFLYSSCKYRNQPVKSFYKNQIRL